MSVHHFLGEKTIPLREQLLLCGKLSLGWEKGICWK